MRYIIGLNPLRPIPYIKIAQDLFSDVSDGYLLSEKVFPHITLTQFEIDDTKYVSSLWDIIKKLNQQTFEPKLIGMAFVKGLNEHKDFYWAQITVERDPIIMDLHFHLLDLLKKNNLNSLIDSGDIYKPHITLARINLLKPIPLWPLNIFESFPFKLTIGASDQNGRYLNKMYE